ncbi:MAG: hypothetical protein ACYTFY_01250 [Planctomycetota bacterium]|jgi:hypothetical protein
MNTTSFITRHTLSLKLICLIIFSFALYSQSLSSKRLAWDDFSYVGRTQVPAGRIGLQDFLKCFDPAIEQNEFAYKPLQLLSYKVDILIWNGSDFGYHFTNILLHTICTILSFFVVRKLTKSETVAFISALLFTAFPYHTEAICWISERKGILACIFAFTALLSDFKYRESGRSVYAAAGILSFAASLLSKAMWVTHPFISLILGAYILNNSTEPKKHLRKWLQVVFPIYLVMSIAVISMQIKSGNAAVVVPLGENVLERILFINLTFWNYLLCFVNPAGINPINLWAWKGLPDWEVTYGTLTISLLLIAAGFYYIKKHMAPVLCMLIFVIALVPVLNIVPMLYPHGDRFLYGPSLAILALLGSLSVKLLNSKIFKYAPLIIVLIYSGYTLVFQSYWLNDYSLFSFAAEKDPDNQRAYFNLGATLQNYENTQDEAIKFYQLAVLKRHREFYNLNLSKNALKNLFKLLDLNNKPDQKKDFCIKVINSRNLPELPKEICRTELRQLNIK